MAHEIKSLEGTSLQDVLVAMNTSFSDYIIPLQLNLDQLKFKILAEDIDLKLSVGVFEGQELVALMLHALREKEGMRVAYNAGTGVVPSHRRKGLVAQMYQALKPRLESLKTNEMILEVIESNTTAIKAYEKEGYSIKRRLIGFAGACKAINEKKLNIKIITLDVADFSKLKTFWDVTPSWQNEFKSIENAVEHYCVLGAFQDEEQVGYLIYNPKRSRIVQIAVAPLMRRRGIGSALVAEMCSQINTEEISIFNIDETSLSSVAFFKALLLRPHVAQFEMVKRP